MLGTALAVGPIAALPTITTAADAPTVPVTWTPVAAPPTGWLPVATPPFAG